MQIPLPCKLGKPTVIIYVNYFPLHLRIKHKGQLKVFWPKSRIHILMLPICFLISQLDKSVADPGCSG